MISCNFFISINKKHKGNTHDDIKNEDINNLHDNLLLLYSSHVWYMRVTDENSFPMLTPGQKKTPKFIKIENMKRGSIKDFPHLSDTGKIPRFSRHRRTYFLHIVPTIYVWFSTSSLLSTSTHCATIWRFLKAKYRFRYSGTSEEPC